MALLKLLIALGATIYASWLLEKHSGGILEFAPTPIKQIGESPLDVDRPITAEGHKMNLYAGELPGYTGWARPASTLAGYFDPFLSECPPRVESGHVWRCSIHCTNEACQNGTSLFYVRAYGPAVLPGTIKDYHNGTYDVTFIPFDKGLYTVEAVLTFSHPPSFEDYPLASSTWEPAYEGYMLPGFPKSVSVDESKDTQTEQNSMLPLCKMNDLLDENPTSSLETSRWVVTEKIIGRNFTLLNNSDQVTFEGYAKGDNALGVTMDYLPKDCRLHDKKTVHDAMTKCRNKSNAFFIFIGDSNMENMKKWAQKEEGLKREQYRFVNIKSGLKKRMETVRNEIDEVVQEQEQQNFSRDIVVVFNSGLHDIMQTCASEKFFHMNVDTNARDDVRCGDLYRKNLEQLVLEVKRIPSALTVFQTTTAGWPKWGTFGFAWPIDMRQPLVFSTHIVEHFNSIAWDVMKNMNVSVYDSFWMTLARPDHREAEKDDENNKLRLVHAGPEIYSSLTRKLLMMTIETLCPAIFSE